MQRLIRFWRNLRLRAKFLSILLTGIALISVTCIAALHIPLRAYDEELYKSSSQMITLFAEQIQNELKNYEDISFRILTDKTLQENLTVMRDTPPGTLKWITAKSDVADRVAYYSLWFSNAVCFQLKSVGGTIYSHFFEISTGADALTQARMDAATDQHGRYVWLAEDGEQPRLFLVREIREIQDMVLDTLDILLIEVDFPALVEQYSRGMEKLDLDPLCAVYRDGLCLYASDDSIRNFAVGADGYTHMKVNGREKLCVRYTASDGMNYVILVDYGNIRFTTAAAVSIMVFCIIGATILVLLVSTG